MKRVLSLFLAVLMVVAAVPAMALSVAAEGEAAASPYVIYQEDFETLDASLTKYEVLQALGWYVPEAFRDTDAANYAVKVQNPGEADENKVLQVSTVQPGGLANDGVVTIMGSDMMAIVREGDFTVSYELTYRAGTTNADGYSALIYNFNERDGLIVAEGNVTAYGIAAVRACGTGMNGLFYPRYTAAEFVSIEDAPNTGANVMTNRYSATGAYPSLYARLTGATEEQGDIRTGSFVMQDVTLAITLDYDYDKGVSVYVNGILVSSPLESNRDANYNTYSWEDFITRNSGYALSLLTKANVVAEIDNITVTAENIGTELEPEEMPELLVTEINAAGTKVSGTSYGWAEYLEIYNPTDRYIDLAEYTVTVRNYYYEGDIDSIFTDDRYAYYDSLAYGYLIHLGEIMGRPLVSKTVYYIPASEISEYEGRIAFANPSGSHAMQDDGACTCHPAHDTGARYSRQEDGTYKRDPAGMFCAVHFTESWNARYEQGNEDYNYNTLLAPGECVMIYFMSDSSKSCWTAGVNAGQNQGFAISSEASFRNVYQNYGLGVYTKVIAQNQCNMGNNIQRLYGIAKTYDENGNKLTKSMTVHQAMKTHVVSYAEFSSPFMGAGMYEEDGHLPESSNFGKTGYSATYGYSGVYLYGVDASSDPSRGTLYNFKNVMNSVAYAHVGKLSSAQKIMFDVIYKKDTIEGVREPGELMITEIVPRTNNLLGEDKSAFTAMELTNTSDHAVNLYRYSLVRTEQDHLAYPDKTFTRAVALKPGNPVTKGLANGAYYYFAQDYISNPETCILQPGETAVVWFLTEGTYESYMYDVDFGFDYFRQYWANNGSPQLAVKREDGTYATQVVAVDGMMSATYNADNANVVFNLSPTGSNVYGVALAAAVESLAPVEDVVITEATKPSVPDNLIVSAAFLGNAATYYVLDPIIVNNTEGVPVIVNKLSYSTMPANMGMRYVVGLSGSSKCSQMLNTMKTQLFKISSDNALTPTVESGKAPRLQFRTNVALMTPSLGKLDGKEIYPVKDSYIYSVTDAEQNTINYVANISNLYVQTLQGAALSTAGATARLRFDAALPADQYAELVALCGAQNVKLSTIVFKTNEAADLERLTKQTLNSAGVGYTELATKLMYYKDSFAVAGAYFDVPATEYATSYTAVTLIEYTLPGADAATVLYSSVAASASVRNVAQSALWDTNDVQTSEYIYAIEDGEYSRYSPALQEKLRAYTQA